MNDVSILVVDRREPGGYAALKAWLGSHEKAEQAATLVPQMPYLMVGTMPSGGELDKLEHVVNPFANLAQLQQLMLRRLETVRRALGDFGRGHLVFEAKLVLKANEKEAIERALERFAEAARYAARQGTS